MTDVAIAFYCDLDFDQALVNFKKSDVDPRQLLQFYPDLFPPAMNQKVIATLVSKTMEEISMI